VTDNPVVTADPELHVERTRADEEPGVSLLASMSAEIDDLYAELPGSLDSIPATAEQMSDPDGSFLVISDSSGPLACGGLKRLDVETAEIKRMYVAGTQRGRGLGRRLLVELESECRRLGYRRIRLDTGSDQPAARALYESAGYRGIPDYNGNPLAAFWFEKELV
jgi:GNAT superfamily N-acetyltransferase